MNKVIGWTIGGAVVAAIAWSGQQASKQERAEAMEMFSVAESEAPMMKTCEGMLSSNNLEFKSGVSSIVACACVARELTDQVRADEAGAAMSFLSFLISSNGGTSKTEAEFFSTIEHIRTTYKMSEIQALSVVSTAGDVLLHCGDPRNLETAEQTASREAALEQLKANRAAKTAEACEEVRRRGIQTDRCDGK